MHSTKSKCRVSFAASAVEGKSSPLPLATLCLLGVLLFDQIGFGSALRCYQVGSSFMSWDLLIVSPIKGPTRAAIADQRITD
jgi:hypothetical protein